ncbi:DNA translocase FtsK [Paenibacillus sp. UNC451MF]|uniref:FtsK/SpoIIIE family DNA translocase n=1 Tax=Paenibacillus sp. UNC451MF TaxID=1449063 RepID=UPI000B067FF6
MKTNLKYELYGIVILTLSVIAISQEGPVSRSFKYLFRFLIGSMEFIIPLVFIYIGLYVLVKRSWPVWRTTRKAGILLIILAFILMSHITLFDDLYPKGKITAGMIMSQSWSSLMTAMEASERGRAALDREVGGGIIGASLYSMLYFLFANLGAKLIQYMLILIGILLVTRLSIGDIVQKVKGRRKFADTLLGQYIQRKMLARKHKPIPVAVKKKPAAIPYIPEDNEFDEETLKPERKEKKNGKKRSLFFDLIQPKAKTEPSAQQAFGQDEVSEEFEHTTDQVKPTKEQTVYHAADEAEEIEHEPVIPVIRDFQEHVKQESFNPQDDQAVQAAPVTAKAKSTGAAATEDEGGAPEDFDILNQPLAAPYELPSFQLLSKPNLAKGAESLDYKAVARKLEATLESFGVRAKVLEVVRGPSVTRYEIQPDVGVKVSRIVGLTDDIALALAAKDIRMEAPIPGKSAIGIEVPNTEVSIVTMREVMETTAFQESSSRLSITFGRDISGQPIVGNLARMPHMLVAGATGSGKSVCINGIITSILYKAKPDEVKFLMIDPKMVELNVYNGIPHLLAPVVTDPRRASLALKKVVVEMEKRYELFSKSGTRNIEGYNNMLVETQTGAPLPYIVVIVDELADLMMVAANDVEDAICRLAQMARAAGIHLIIATQRPSVDVITGVIKANIPSRIAFGVSSQVDSRTILDMAGAEKLLGRGDMLYLPMGASKPVRVQGAFLSDNEVESVVNFVRTQGQANYVEDMVPQIEEQTEAPDQMEDELYDQAVQIILEAKQASVSLLQRRMRVGYTRAARLIDSMEAKGIVGPYEGSKPREVLVSLEQYQGRLSS